MNGTILHDGEILVRQERALRRITLNRPKALNALTLDMAVTMTAHLRAWAADPGVGAVLLDGAGERGLCAGGDIRALYDAAKAGAPFSFPERFWADEYHLDVLIARYPKPVVAVMDGVVMGGGVGLSAHAAHRIVTERSSIAMPEVGIGFFPDVGVSFLLARAPGQVGTHLELTGERMGAADAIYCGLADIFIPAANLADLPAALADCRAADDVRARLDALSVALSVSPPAGRLPAAREWIDRCYDAHEVEEIVARLRSSSVDAARAALATLGKMSPTSLKIALRNIRSAVSFSRVEQSFQQDYRVALACIAGHDFVEGIRATIVDKDRNPVWRPDKLESVTPEIVDRHFRSVGELELTFTD
ncbi:MAG TPA: enoyl-CoA hydratase/isomerase family protein [Xanthobacteraceae bacterium]|nr:enoyl-CoA hydratase/isomerase family protein [Xanthobacteraceae bacterium]